MNLPIQASNRENLARLAQLADFFVRPLEFMHDDHLSELGLGTENIRNLAQHPAFCKPLNRAVISSLGLSKLSFSHDLADRIEADDSLKITLALLRSDQETLISLVKYCTAVQLYPQIRTCVMKSRRKHLAGILGQEAFLTAMRESSVFFPSLVARSKGVQLESYMEESEAATHNFLDLFSLTNFTLHTLLWEGGATLIAFARKADEACAKLFELRFPNRPEESSVARSENLLDSSQTEELKKLLIYRGFTW